MQDEKQKTAGMNQEPQFIEFLSDKDRKDYENLKQDLWSLENKFKRNKRLISLQNALDKIRDYCIKNDSNDWKRSIVCGVIWYDEGIAINTRQLRILINKCKSSINGALLKMGYTSSTTKGEGFDALLRKIPYLRGNFLEQRMWTVRKKLPATPLPERVEPMPAIMEFDQNTPQPVLSQFNGPVMSTHDEIRQMLGMPQEKTDSLIQKCEYDFFQDPMCCCPIQWALTDNVNDDYTTFG